jgi:hypothetical protein
MLNKPASPTHPSLFPLRAALTLAESAAPSRPRRLNCDERLAMQLIARMQARYKKRRPFLAPKRLFAGEEQHDR